MLLRTNYLLGISAAALAVVAWAAVATLSPADPTEWAKLTVFDEPIAEDQPATMKGPVPMVAQLAAPQYPQFAQVGSFTPTNEPSVQLCQACYPYGGRPMCGVQCQDGCYCDGKEPGWHHQQCLPFDQFGPGEYVGPARPAHVADYRLRVDDELGFTFILSRTNSNGPYRLEIGDRITIESVTDDKLNRHHLNSGSSTTSDEGQGILVQPDGNVSLPLLGQVKAENRTITELSEDLEERYKKYYKVPGITVTPLKVNTRLYDFRDAIDQRFGEGGLGTQARVTPEGTVQLPAIGSVHVQGLSIRELEAEINARYAADYQGLDVTVQLINRAPRFVYVLGEVVTPGRYELEGPTTVMQSIALAEGWNNGGNLRHIVVFRRGEDWRLMATRLDLRGAMLGKRPCPADEIWVRDGDIVLVPKSALLLADDFIELVFTRGIYGVLPTNYTFTFTKLTTL